MFTAIRKALLRFFCNHPIESRVFVRGMQTCAKCGREVTLWEGPHGQ